MPDENGMGAVEDLDPGAPEWMAESPFASEEANRANMGEDGAGDLPEVGLEASVEDFGHPGRLALDVGKAHDFLKDCMTCNPRVKYGLGAKIKPGQTRPGRDFNSVDCSGFIREAIRRSTNLGGKFPDGSVVQHEWVRTRDFSRVDLDAGAARDGAVRIAFFEPKDSPQKSDMSYCCTTG